MPTTLVKNGDILEAKCDGRWSEVADFRDKVKDVPGRRWNPAEKQWEFPAEPQTADRLLKSLQPEVSDEFMNWLRESMSSHEESLTTPLPDDAELLIPWANKRMPWQPEEVNDEKVVGLLPFQRAGVDAMATWKRALLADQMGKGKTLSSISAIEEYSLRNGYVDGPKLVIAPASVLGSWARELNRWLEDPTVVIVDGSSPAKRHEQITQGIKDNAWVVVNWEQIRVKKEKVKQTTKRGTTRSKTHTWMKEPLFQYPEAAFWDLPLDKWDIAAHTRAEKEFKGKGPGWLGVVADEAHRAKNRQAQQSQGLHRIEGIMQIAATGTPIMNSPDELWSILRWLWPEHYHERGAAYSQGAIPYWTFYETYVDYWEDHFGRKLITGVKNPDALRFALKGKVIRRLAKGGGLRRIYFDVDLTPKQQKLYDDAEKDMWLQIEKDIEQGNLSAIEFAKKAAAGATTTQLMQIPNGAARFVRLQQIIENAANVGGDDESAVMDDFMTRYEDSRPEQWLVFCKYKLSCELLAERLQKKYGARVAIYTGDVATHDRTEIEDAYQRGDIDVIVGTIQALYSGITLTSGHLQYWLSREVVPAINEQGEARQDRMGQQADEVLVYIPHAVETVAAGKVNQINKLKEKIVKTIIPQNEIKESKQ